MRKWIVVAAALAVLTAAAVALVLAEETGGSKPRLRTIRNFDPASCYASNGAKEVRFSAGSGDPLWGAVLGSGDTGVVLAHQAQADMCQWVEYAPFLARKGYRVLVLAFSEDTSRHGKPAADDVSVAAAAKVLRKLGAKRIVLMGASRGATAVLSAARLVDVDGVVALSPPVEYNGSDGLGGVQRFRGRLLLAVGEDDSEFTSGVIELGHLAVTTTKRTIVVRGTAAHGVDLLHEPDESSAIDAAVVDLLRRV